jgi:hypothetical protein
MPLYRVTCPMEERYVVAKSIAEAMECASTHWKSAKDPTPKGNGYAILRVDTVSESDPWTK